MKCLKNRYLITHLCQIARTCQTGRAGTDDSYLDTVGLFRLCGNDAVFSGPVRYKTRQLSDGNRLPLDAADTFSLALALLRTYTAADSGKGAGLSNGSGCIRKFALFYL